MTKVKTKAKKYKRFNRYKFEEMLNQWEQYKSTRVYKEMVNAGKDGGVEVFKSLPLYKRGFAIFLGYNPEYFDEWAKEENIKLTKDAKRFFNLMGYECEQSLLDQMDKGSTTGAIFQLKCNYGYIEEKERQRLELEREKLELQKDGKIGDNIVVNIVKDDLD